MIVLDDEKPREHVFGDFLKSVPPYPKVVYEPPPQYPNIFPGGICGRGAGYDRQQV